MDNSRFEKVLPALLDATRNGRAKWVPTAREDAFRVALGEGVVRVSGERDRDGDFAIEIVLLNRKGTEVASVTELFSRHDTLNGRTVQLAYQLFMAARDSALNVDSVIDSMLEDLRIGVTRPLPSDDDDIPF